MHCIRQVSNSRNSELIIITHGHQDHAGSASRLQAITRAPVAVHENDAEMLRAGTQGNLVPTGLTGRIAGVFFGSSEQSEISRHES